MSNPISTILHSAATLIRRHGLRQTAGCDYPGQCCLRRWPHNGLSVPCAVKTAATAYAKQHPAGYQVLSLDWFRYRDDLFWLALDAMHPVNELDGCRFMVYDWIREHEGAPAWRRRVLRRLRRAAWTHAEEDTLALRPLGKNRANIIPDPL